MKCPPGAINSFFEPLAASFLGLLTAIWSRHHSRYHYPNNYPCSQSISFWWPRCHKYKVHCLMMSWGQENTTAMEAWKQYSL